MRNFTFGVPPTYITNTCSNACQIKAKYGQFRTENRNSGNEKEKNSFQ
jgi:hypothetical protein